MKMKPQEIVGHIFYPLSLLLASTSGTSPAIRPSDPVNNSNNATSLNTTVTMMTARNVIWDTATATLTADKPIQNSNNTSTISPISNQNSTSTKTVSHMSTTAPNSTQNSLLFRGADSDSEVQATTTPGQNNRLTTGLTTSIKAASVSAVSVPATNPPFATAPTTHRVQTTASTSSTSNVTPQEILTSASPDTSDAVTLMSTKVSSTTLGEALTLSHSEKMMTIFFSVLLGVAALVIFLYTLDRCKRKKTQYLHRPLYNNSEDTGERFMPADDTLVISGGLYDGPRVYNPTMTTANDDEDFHCDQPSFASRPTQFQLELLKNEGEKYPGNEASTFQRFQPMEEDA